MGNLDARRDWGFAGDYVDAMWRMLQRDQPSDYVIGTGAAHSVRDLVETAFSHVGLDWREYVVSDPVFMRPAEVDVLLADSSKAEAELGWKPTVDFKSLVEMMVDADLDRLNRQR
jgi:GDPmannose 4,6-dehydratase